MTKKNRQIFEINPPLIVNAKVEYWILKIILELGGHREFIHKDFFSDDQIAAAFQLDQWFIDKEPYLDRVAILKSLRLRLETLKTTFGDPLLLPYSENLTNNLNQLKTLIHLSECDIAILEFMLITHNEPLLSSAMDFLGMITSEYIYTILGQLLSKSDNEIRYAFSPNSELLRTGLIRIDKGSSLYFRSKIDLLSRNFIETMCSYEATPFSLLKDVVEKSCHSHLTLEHYHHIKNELAILLPYLTHALDQHTKGVNILIYGDPGTGKTELTRVIADHFSIPAYEVSSEDSYGEPAEKGNERLLAYLAAQNFFANQKALIIFDEIEDIFQDEQANSAASFSKAWLNRVLENNQIPALWICNDTYHIDPSIIRRFDMVIQLNPPPKSERKKMLEEALHHNFERHILNELASSKNLVPAIVQRVADVINPIKETLTSSVEDATITLINGTLKAQGADEILVQKIGGLMDIYDPKFTNADTDLALLAKRLKTYHEAKVCLYGPSGTGKSAYAHWLADYLNKPLLIKKVSDLMDKYVGETEKQIAEAFREANETQSILLVDEIDSFLRDRRFAQQGYEVTMVNEMLMQMERFSGIFIATTNLMDQMDQAVLRRFDFKSKFDYLKHDQAWELFQRQCDYLNFDIENSSEQEFKVLQQLTPGDFAITARQTKLGVITSSHEIITQLKKESMLKARSGMTIGFIK